MGQSPSSILAISLSFRHGVDGREPRRGRAAAAPTAVYGVVLLLAAIAYYILQSAIIAREGRQSLLAVALGRDWKGKLSPAIYLAAIPLAFVSPWLANALYAVVAFLWLVPDRRIERALQAQENASLR